VTTAGFSVVVPVGAFLEQQFNALGAGIDRGLEEWRVSVRVADVHLDAGVELRADGLQVAVADRLGKLRGQ
jgi:hypothetical protein